MGGVLTPNVKKRESIMQYRYTGNIRAATNGIEKRNTRPKAKLRIQTTVHAHSCRNDQAVSSMEQCTGILMGLMLPRELTCGVAQSALFWQRNAWTCQKKPNPVIYKHQ